MTAALRVAALCCASTHGLQMTSRRRCLNGLGGAAFITALAPRRAGAEAAPTPDELKKTHAGLRAHADAPQGLAEDHGRLLRQRAALEGEGAGRGHERRRALRRVAFSDSGVHRLQVDQRPALPEREAHGPRRAFAEESG